MIICFTGGSGEQREAWIVDYVDQDGERHIETFDKKKEADARHAQVNVNVSSGLHVAPSKSKTVREAGESWIKTAGMATASMYRSSARRLLSTGSI
jgi:hypothetical protein